ncbi:Uma2 family endonuclease [Saccharopolyspora gloriosae]|uniref:Uma2 family endonuclease n=1 Tax=Saccharopolyspora gloriosae TaxID=455344 RepID=A0A840NQ25_9PSEU|nr:Uma2 family endonuclease [Saccharopolyspora gloriosae]MBB5071232.1 Uma2 family endonuclease [Saccharopolyspora gloriosae]
MTATMPERRTHDRHPESPECSDETPTARETAERLWRNPELDGFRIEAISGRVVVTPPPDGGHAVALTRLMRILDRASVEEDQFEVLQNIGVALPDGPGDYALPDLSVVDEDFRDHRKPGGQYPADVFHLVVEITSSNWEDDLRIKPEAYARAGIPVYLIGDRRHREAKVLWRPEGGEYRSAATYASGETLKLPGDVAAEIPVDVLLQR